MPYLKKQSKKIPNRQLRGFVVFLVVVGTFFIFRSVAFSTPFYLDTAGGFFSSKRKLMSEITALQSALDRTNSERALQTVLLDENQKLKAELGRTDRPLGTLAAVLFPPGRSVYNTFVIDAGSAQGLREGQTVFAFDTVALGTISEVKEKTATVLLYSDPGRETAGTIVGSDSAVTLIGRGGGEYEVRMPRDIHFEIGETITLQSTLPRVFATIEKISTDPRDPFQRLLAKVPLNLQNLKWVIVE